MIDIKKMYQAGVHFGHKTSFRNPKMNPYLFGVRQDLSIFDLRVTRHQCEEALKFVAKVVAGRGSIMMVATKRQSQIPIQAMAEACDMPFVSRRWLGGMLTNFKTIKQSVRQLSRLEDQLAENDLQGLTKKEILQLNRKKDKLQDSLGGIKNMKHLPDAMFVIDVNVEANAVAEANKLGIPVIAVVDSNASPDGVDYVIPGNDDSYRSIAYYCHMMQEVILDAKSKLPKEKKEVVVKKASSAAKSVAKASDDNAVKTQESSEKREKKVIKISKKVASDVAEESKEQSDKAAAKKTTDTSASKKPAAKKTVAKKPTAKKTAAKKTEVKKVDKEVSAKESESEK